jgi:hypothetical protein
MSEAEPLQHALQGDPEKLPHPRGRLKAATSHVAQFQAEERYDVADDDYD